MEEFRIVEWKDQNHERVAEKIVAAFWDDLLKRKGFDVDAHPPRVVPSVQREIIANQVRIIHRLVNDDDERVKTFFSRGIEAIARKSSEYALTSSQRHDLHETLIHLLQVLGFEDQAIKRFRKMLEER